MTPASWKKTLASFALVGASLAYVVFLHFDASDELSASNPPVPPNASSNGTAVPARTGAYIDGIYTGSAADAYFGTVQVRATISGGQITDVAFLQYPDDRGTSREISNRTMPILKQEAIRMQSASVDIISGATQTTQGFRQSLGDALAQAGA